MSVFISLSKNSDFDDDADDNDDDDDDDDDDDEDDDNDERGAGSVNLFITTGTTASTKDTSRGSTWKLKELILKL